MAYKVHTEVTTTETDYKPSTTKLKLSRQNIERISPPQSGQTIYRDTELPGFGLRVTPKLKTFIVEKKVKGRCTRKVIGAFPVFPPDLARKEAQIMLLGIATSTDVGRSIKAQGESHQVPSLQEVFDQYLSARTLKARTREGYQAIFDSAFEKWHGLPICAISKNMVDDCHVAIGAKSRSSANLSMRVLRAIFNYAIEKYEDEAGNPILKFNPVSRLSRTKAWFSIKRRQTLITEAQIKPWLNAVLALKNEKPHKKCLVIRDYLLTLLFFGFRKTECSQILWADVDLAAKTVTLRDTKNGDDHRLPIPDCLVPMFTANKAKSTSPWVFPGYAEDKPIQEPRKLMVKVTAKSGVPFACHDLRRTFATIAEQLDIPGTSLKRLLNHRSNDVTDGYVIYNVERLRGPMNRIAEFILSKAELSADEFGRQFGGEES